MCVLFIKGDKFEYNTKVYELDDMFSARLFEESDKIADQYDADICIVNEVFLNRVHPYKAIELFLSRLDIKTIKLENPDNRLVPLILDFAQNKRIEVRGVTYLYKFKNIICGQINIILSSIYLVLKMISIPNSSEITSKKERISLIRTPASKNKLGFIEDIDFKYEELKNANTIYSCFSKRKRIYWILKSWVLSYKEMERLTNYVHIVLGSYNSAATYRYYSKRVVHTLLYALILDEFLANNSGKTFYTGNNLDRFSLIEEKIANKHNIDIVCIPHGLEYGFKFPHCFIGDKFYTTSHNASIHLNKLYETTKFIYNHDLALKMFSVNYDKKKNKRDIVFFTEPREIEVNYRIIEELIPLLNSKQLQLSLKLHPKDKKSNYEKYSQEINIIQEFNESVTGNICISRKSTTLLEAIYNNSVAAAILINMKDKVIFNTFPSLQDKNIKVFNSIDTLYEWILEKRKIH